MTNEALGELRELGELGELGELRATEALGILIGHAGTLEMAVAYFEDLFDIANGARSSRQHDAAEINVDLSTYEGGATANPQASLAYLVDELIDELIDELDELDT
jgi:hypothetical protein